MNIAFVGCGFVFDLYMRTILAHPTLLIQGLFDTDADRLAKVSQFYNIPKYASYDELLKDDDVDLVVNLTNIESHFEVSKRALEEGKHVYSEKPLTKDLAQTKELFVLAEEHGVELYAAPCNIYSDTVRTMLKAVDDGAIGKPLLIYAELDDNPIHIMEFDKVRSTSGAPWPLIEEIKEGCTLEHVGYHLTWICALLGPVEHITAFSDELIEKKAVSLQVRTGTPDYSVACLSFASGATARLTCSVVAPRDHRMRIIGDEGEISSDSYRQYRSPVYLERFSKRTLTLRKMYTLRKYSGLGNLLGIGGKKLKLVRNQYSSAVEGNWNATGSFKTKFIDWLRRKEVYSQDKLSGIAVASREIETSSQRYLNPEFLIHINELSLIIHKAGRKESRSNQLPPSSHLAQFQTINSG